MDNIILIGFMGAGKTTVGRLLAEKNNMTHMDFDDKIEEMTGCTIQEIFNEHGEAAFRQLEHEFLRDFSLNNHVVSTGGGIVLMKKNREILKKMPPVVYLKADPDIFIDRLKQDKTTIRPLVATKAPAEVKDVYLPRVKYYEESATFSVDTSSLSPEEVTAAILEKIKKLGL